VVPRAVKRFEKVVREIAAPSHASQPVGAAVPPKSIMNPGCTRYADTAGAAFTTASI
jgi:hypothetical protein